MFFIVVGAADVSLIWDFHVGEPQHFSSPADSLLSRLFEHDPNYVKIFK